MKHSFAALAACALLASAASAQDILTAEVASPGGIGHFNLTHVAQVASEAGIAEIQVLEDQTLTGSVQNVAEGKTDMSNTPAILPFLLSRNAGPYSGLPDGQGAELAANLRLMVPFNFSSHALYGFATNGITSYDQLEGKTILNGPPNGGALANARAYLQSITGLEEGNGYNGVQVGWGQMTQAVLDGTADINMLPIGFPDETVVAAASAGVVNIISMPKATFESEEFQRVMKGPGRAPVVIPADELGYGDNPNVQLISEDGMFRGVNIAGLMIVNAGVSEDLVEAMTAEYIRTMDDLLAKSPALLNAGIGVVDAELTAVCGANPVKYHPGAVKAWEAAGYDIADCAK
ncbi:MAG: TAXI family TRAP transporter solute-binding subunit [Pseudomonadota bacterium]